MSIYTVAGFPYSDELYHFGIKGQKWGIRRYQNEDGTLTEAGKKRYRVESIEEYRKRELESGKNVSNELGNSIRNASDIVRRSRNKAASKVEKSVKDMSDEELRRKINRIQLERQYSMLTSSDKTSGRDKALRVLETTGSVVAIAGGVLGMAATIKGLMPVTVKTK